jgi:hypothetical protein
LPPNGQQVQAARNSTPDEHGKRKLIYMHRQLMNPLDGQDVDHTDQHRFFVFKLVDNRRENLRNVSTSQNQANHRPRVGCSSCYKGVSWFKRDGKWMAQLMVNQRRIYLGLFVTELEAAVVYDVAHQHHFPGISEGLNRAIFPEEFQ